MFDKLNAVPSHCPNSAVAKRVLKLSSLGTSEILLPTPSTIYSVPTYDAGDTYSPVNLITIPFLNCLPPAGVKVVLPITSIETSIALVTEPTILIAFGPSGSQ